MFPVQMFIVEAVRQTRTHALEFDSQYVSERVKCADGTAQRKQNDSMKGRR